MRDCSLDLDSSDAGGGDDSVGEEPGEQPDE
jgi:hypothetical protein